MENKIILGIDTTGEKCSVGLAKNGEAFGGISESTPQEHSDKLIHFVDRLLKKKHLKIEDINAIAVSIGPGSFTGLRVGVATAKALAQLLEIPIIGIPTLDIIALNAVQSTEYRVQSKKKLICSIVDARKEQVYAAVYETAPERHNVKVSKRREENKELKKISEDLMLSINDLLKLRTLYSVPCTVFFVGNGLKLYGDIIKKKLGKKALFVPQEFWYPSAINIAIQGYKKLQKNEKGENLFELKPKYIREPDIMK